MKHAITIPIALLLIGILIYSLYPKKQKITEAIKVNEIKTVLIDKNPSKSPAPKPYISQPEQNGLSIGNNWRSK